MIQYQSTDTIIALAKRRGSSAKTRAGAWKFLLANLPGPITGNTPRVPWYIRQYTEQRDLRQNVGDPHIYLPALESTIRRAWYRHHQINRIERNADAILRMHGYDPDDPNTPGREKYRASVRGEWRTLQRSAIENILVAQAEHASLNIGDAVYRHNWDEDRSYSRYSKQWHRNHGPAITISNRRIERLEYAAEAPGGYRIASTIPVEAFRGNYLINAIARDLQIEPVKYPKHLRSVQLNPYFVIEHIRTIAGVALYRRTFAGQLVDYCILSNGETYHAPSISEAIAGLRKKRRASADYERQTLDMDYALSIGFCRAGVEQFCDDYGLDCDGAYTRAELKRIVTAGNGRAKKYRAELAKAGIL
mgnify:CR=1 FL=1